MRPLLSALLLLISIVSAPFTALADTTPEPIVIGAIYNLSGDQAPLDVASAQGAQLAVHELNKSGGLLDRPVQLKLVDGKSKPAVIQQEAKQFAHDKNINIVLGLSDTNMVLAAAPALAQAHKLFITSGATSPNLPEQVPNYLILACYSDNMQASTLANYAFNKLAAKKAVILADEDMSYTILLAQYFQQAYTSLGGQIVGIRTFKHKANITHQLAQLKAAKATPDVIFLAAGPSEAPALIKQIRQAGYQQPILGGDSFDALTKNLGKQANNIYFTNHVFMSIYNPNSRVRQFIHKYHALYHQTPANSFAALGYDTVKLIASAIKTAQSTDPAKVRQALLSTNNWPGVTSKFSYNNNPIPNKTVTIIKLHNGREMLAHN